MPEVRLGVDVGGTFNDFVAYDSDTGSFSVGKTLTTPQGSRRRDYPKALAIWQNGPDSRSATSRRSRTARL